MELQDLIRQSGIISTGDDLEGGRSRIRREVSKKVTVPKDDRSVGDRGGAGIRGQRYASISLAISTLF